MSTTALPLSSAPATGLARSLSIFATETRYEFIRALRTRTFSLSVIGLPGHVLLPLRPDDEPRRYGQRPSVRQDHARQLRRLRVVGAALFGIALVWPPTSAQAGWSSSAPAPCLRSLIFWPNAATAIAFGVTSSPFSVCSESRAAMSSSRSPTTSAWSVSPSPAAFHSPAWASRSAWSFPSTPPPASPIFCISP